MKRLKYLLLASLVAVAACDEETPTDTIIQIGSVSVTVTAGGVGVAGATVSLGAAGTTPQTTPASGQVSFANVPVGTYVVTVTGLSSDVICSSTTQPVTVASGATTGVTFACNIVQTSSISGTVSFANGNPRPGATVTITRTAPAPAAAAVNVTTDANGRFSLTGLRSGTYTVSLPVTTGCTTAAITRTGINVAAGESRVENFQCTTTPVGGGAEPATVTIRSITTPGTAAAIPLPDNQIFGIVNVNIEVNEGDQRVTRVELLLGDRVVCTHDRTVTAAPEGMALADFEVTCVVNTAEFNQTTGVPNWLNGPLPLRARIYTVAGGSTVAASTGTRNITLVNIDATYATVSATRNALSTNTSAFGTGLLWWNGDVTVRALPVMYSGLAIQNVTINVTGFVPTQGTDALPAYFAGGGGNVTVSRLLTAAPFQTTLLAANDINDSGNPFSANNGVGLVEDPGMLVTIFVLRSDGQPGPGVAATTVCSDGRLPSTNFPVTGCANGQPANAIRLDNSAPVIGQLDRIIRWSASYAWPSRAEPSAVVAAFSGVTGWIHEGHDFTATRLVPGNAATVTNATAPRIADNGVGLPTTGYIIFRMGTSPAAMTVVTEPTLPETFNTDVYYLNVTGMDVFGVAGSTVNQRTRFYDASFDGTGTSSGNISTISAVGSGARVGIDKGDPCFTSNGTTCNGALLNTTRLDTDREVIGVTGTLTLGGGGVMDGTQYVSQLLDLTGPEGGSPSFFPQNPVVTRLRRMFPGLSQSQQCWIGVISGGSCVFAGASGQNSGTTGSYDFFTPVDGADFWSQIDPLTGARTARNTVRDGTTQDMDLRTVANNTGYFVLEQRVVDNAGNTSPTMTKTWVYDRMAAVVSGVSYPTLVQPGGQTTATAAASDDLDLDRSEFFLIWSGATLAVLQSTSAIGEFGPAAYTMTGNAQATTTFYHSLRTGAGGAVLPTTNQLFRVFDFGENAGESPISGVPALNLTGLPAGFANDPANITAASLFASANVVCWDTDTNGCPTNPTSTTLTYQVTGPTQVPFVRVDFLVGIDVNNDGAVDTDLSGNRLWAPVGQGSAVSVIGNVSTFTRTVTVQELVAASRRTFITIFPADPVNRIHVMAIGYRLNGTAHSTGISLAPTPCPNVAGTDANCTIELNRN